MPIHRADGTVQPNVPGFGDVTESQPGPIVIKETLEPGPTGPIGPQGPTGATGPGMDLPPAGGANWVVFHNIDGSFGQGQLTLDQIGPAYSITLVLTSPSTQLELGQTATNPTFASTQVRPAASLILSDNQGSTPQDVTLTPTTFTFQGVTYHFTSISTVLFTLTGHESGGSNKTAQTSITWLPRVFWGIGAAGGSTASFLVALASSALASSRNRSFSVNATGTNKIYYGFPQSMGTATFSINGFTVTFLGPTIIPYLNPYNVTQNYYLYESNQGGLGQTNVGVS